ncbi:MAG: hypothetical protein U0269_00005 [Polyangiales bacterium]
MGGVLLVVVGVASCGEGWIRSDPMVNVDPSDLSTGPALSIGLLLRTNGTVDSIPQDTVDALTDGLALARLSDGAPIPITVSSEATSYQDLTYTVRPDAPLERGWHVLSLRYPPGMVLEVNAPITTDEGGWTVARARFFQGSLPLLSAQAAPDPNHAGQFLVSFMASEPCVLADGVSLSSLLAIRSGGRLLACDVDESEAAEQLANPSFVTAHCAGVDGEQVLRIEIASGVVSRSGVPLHDMDAQTSPAVIEWVPGTGSTAPRVPSAALLALR